LESSGALDNPENSEDKLSPFVSFAGEEARQF
jgi:hypothetical protein